MGTTKLTKRRPSRGLGQNFPPPPLIPNGSISFATPVIGATHSDVIVTWAPSENADTYEYESGPSPIAPWPGQVGAGLLNPTVTLTNVDNGLAIWFRVRPRNGGGTPDYSAAPYTVPASPAAAAAKLSMVTNPSAATTGFAFAVQPVLRTLSSTDLATASPGITVTAAIASGAGALSGTLTAVTDENGVATFANLTITGTGSHSLTFSASGLTSVTSSTFNVASVSPPAGLTLFHNSNELGGDGSDPTVVLCDDMHDGFWWTDWQLGGQLSQKGWYGSQFGQFGGVPTPSGAVRTVSGRTVATHGVMSSALGAGNIAEHAFGVWNGSSWVPASNPGAYDEVFIRMYWKSLAGYVYGQEKFLSISRAPGFGINWGMLVTHNEPSGSGSLFYDINASGPAGPERQWGIGTINSGVWYAAKVRIKLNDPFVPNGILQVWVTDCGTGPLPVNPVAESLRVSSSNVQYPERDTTAKKVGSIWPENWANPGSTGERLITNFKVATVDFGLAPEFDP